LISTCCKATRLPRTGGTSGAKLVTITVAAADS
jgi:hypothetical protein